MLYYVYCRKGTKAIIARMFEAVARMFEAVACKFPKLVEIFNNLLVDVKFTAELSQICDRKIIINCIRMVDR